MIEHVVAVVPVSIVVDPRGQVPSTPLDAD